MRVEIKYTDTSSFLPEEIIRQAEQNYGTRATVTLLPDSDTPIDHLLFAVQRLITGDLLTSYYDNELSDLKNIKAEFLFKAGEVFDDVVHETLRKLHQE